MCKFQVKLKWKKKANQFLKDLEDITSIFKQNISNYLEILNVSDGEPEELWNDMKEVVKYDCQKTLSKTKK